MNLVPLGSIAEIQLGKMLSPKSKTGVESYPYLRNQNIQWDRIDLSDLALMDFSERERQKFELRPGDLLVCEGGEPGRCAVWQGELRDCFYQKALHRVRPHKGTADSEFLSLWIRHQAFIGAFEDQNAKTTIAHLPLVRLEQLLVPDISEDKQHRIAARLKAQLAAVEEARQAAQAQVNELDVLKTLALSDVFSRVEEIGQLGEVAKVQSGYAFKSQDFRTSGIRLLRNTNILPGRIYWDETVYFAEAGASKLPGYVMNDGDVVISLDRPIISSGIKVARVQTEDLPALLVQRVGRFLLNPDRLDAAYLYAFMQTTRFIEAISGHDQSLGVPHISPGQVEAVEIPLPSIEEQRRIASLANEVLQTTEQAQVAVAKMLDDIQVLPARLLAQAFEGQ